MTRIDAPTISLLRPEELWPVLTNVPIGDGSVALHVASAKLSTPLSIEGAAPLVITFAAGSELTVEALNATSGADDDGVVGKRTEATGLSLTALLERGPSDAWLKYVCTADVGVDARLPLGPFTFGGAASASTSLAHYRHHPPDTGLVTAVAQDLKTHRIALVRDHVAGLPPQDAVTFETTGQLEASIVVEWSDVFTTEIGSLAKRLGAIGPIAVETTVGAQCSATVKLVDTFLVAFANGARAADSTGAFLHVGIKKGRTRTVDIGAGVSISAELDEDAALDRIADLVVKAVAPIVPHAPDALKPLAKDALKRIAETKIAAAFAYEYNRVRSDATVFQARLAPEQLTPELHALLIGGNVAGAFARSDVLTIDRYLNDRSTVVSRAWGFTLGVGKWEVFGRDRRRVERVTRYDMLKKSEWRSYIGSGGYERTRLSWMVDLKADMRTYAAKPLVRDFEMGLHLAWLRDPQAFNAADLATALDFAALWRICPEASQPWLRSRLAPALGQEAEWSFHVRVPDAALRSIVTAIGAATPPDLADAAAAAMDPGSDDRSASDRRAAFSALWRAALRSRDDFTVDTIAANADRLLPPALAWRERQVAQAHAFDADTVCGLVRSNPDTYEDCERLIRGSRRLAEAIAAGLPDDDVIDKVYADFVGFWDQSHEVRMLGRLLVDVADATGGHDDIERSLTIRAGGTTTVISSRTPPAA